MKAQRPLWRDISQIQLGDSESAKSAPSIDQSRTTLKAVITCDNLVKPAPIAGMSVESKENSSNLSDMNLSVSNAGEFRLTARKLIIHCNRRKKALHRDREP